MWGELVKERESYRSNGQRFQLNLLHKCGSFWDISVVSIHPAYSARRERRESGITTTDSIGIIIEMRTLRYQEAKSLAQCDILSNC